VTFFREDFTTHELREWNEKYIGSEGFKEFWEFCLPIGDELRAKSP
jgi:hypothetical protein